MTVARKVIKTGNSLALTIPSSTISDFNLKEGDICTVTINHSSSSLTYTFTGHPRQLSLINRQK